MELGYGKSVTPLLRGSLFEEKQRDRGSPSGTWRVGSKFWYTCDLYVGASWCRVGRCSPMVWFGLWFNIHWSPQYSSFWATLLLAMFHLSWLCGSGVLVWFFGRKDGGLGCGSQGSFVEHEYGEVFEYGEVDLFHSYEKAIWPLHYVPHPTNYQHFAEAEDADRCAVLGKLPWMN